jgi:hypothetical protein
MPIRARSFAACSLVAGLVVPAVGCVDDVLVADDVIDVSALVAGARVEGVASDPVGRDFHLLVPGKGVLQVDRNGAQVAALVVGENGLEDRPYTDLAVIGDGRFLFIADNEGYLYDAVTSQQKVHFCVEPGFVDCTDENGEWKDTDNDGLCDWEDPAPVEPQPSPVEPLIRQENDALALTGASILAAPRFYEGDTQIEASLRTYDVATGTPTGSADLSGLGLDIAGVDVDVDVLVGVSGDALVRFDRNGGELSRTTLDGVTDGAGVVVDGDFAWVLDRAAAQLVRFALPE